MWVVRMSQKENWRGALSDLAFKGTQRIGTRDYKAEKPLLDRLDELAEQIQTASSALQSEVRLQAEFEQVGPGS